MPQSSVVDMPLSEGGYPPAFNANLQNNKGYSNVFPIHDEPSPMSIRPAEKRSFADFEERQPSFEPRSNDGRVRDAFPRPRNREKLSYSKCEKCREDKQKCLPTERVWPQKCQRCDEKGYDCSKPTESRKGRPSGKKVRQPDAISSASQTHVHPSTTPGDTPEIRDVPKGIDETEEHEKYIDLMNRISYGRMLTTSLKSLRRMKLEMILLFDKDREFDDLWEEKLVECREFEDFVNHYHHDLQLRLLSDSIYVEPASFTILSQAFGQGGALINAYGGDNEDLRLSTLKSHVDILRASGDFGHAMLSHIPLLSIRLRAYQGISEDCKTLIMLKNTFQSSVQKILLNIESEAGFQMKVPRILHEYPLPIPDQLIGLWPNAWGRFRAAGWKVDCLGRTLAQIIMDEKSDCELISDDLVDEYHQDILGQSSLHCYSGREEWMKLPLDHRDDPDFNLDQISQKNGTGQQPLHYAAAVGNVHVCRFLLSREGIDVDCPDIFGRSPLFYAASNGNTRILHLLLEHKSVDIDRSDERGNTPLYVAACSGHFKAVEHLLKRGANSNGNHGKGSYGLTPFVQVVCRQDIDLVRLLGSYEEVDVNVEFIHPFETSIGRTYTFIPLTAAMFSNFSEGIEYLLEHKDIQVNGATGLSRPPLFFAISKRAIHLVKRLVERLDININLTYNGETALHLAIEEAHSEIVEILLAHPNINVNARKYLRKTPLMTAAYYGRKEVVLSLLRHPKVELALEDYQGQTAMFLAGRLKKYEIAEVLREEMIRRAIVLDDS